MSERPSRLSVIAIAAVLFFTLVTGGRAVYAAALTTQQQDAIVSLLQVFDVGPEVIAKVEAALIGGSSAPATSCVNLSYDLYGGSTDSHTAGEVSVLQQFLGITPQTGYFGPITEQAVQQWQSSHGIVSSGAPDTTGYGYVGPKTRAAMSCTSVTPPPPTTVAGPSVPTGLSVSTVSTSQLNLSWNASTDTAAISGYKVFRNGVLVNTVNGESFSDTDLTPGTTYSYTVAAYDTAGATSAQSSSVSAMTSKSSVNAPSATLSASTASITSGQNVTLTWDSTNATSCTGTGFSTNGISGSVTASPTQTTTYVLTCTNSTSSVTSNVTVSVTPLVVTSTPTIDVRNIIPPFNPSLDVVHAPTGFGTGKIWKVGPNEPNTSFAAIARSLQNGDIVEIDAGTYGCTEQSIVWYAQDITVIGVGGRAVFNATGCGISGDKGIFNPRGDNYIIDNIEFIGASGPSGNDAGIRADLGGYVYLTNDYFHDNEDGILFTPSDEATTDLVIDHSEFAHNGSGSGYTHNIYVNTIRSFVLRFSYSHDANVGHEVKSRADSTYILYNRLADEANGTASYTIDLPQGGLSYIIGNVIQKGSQAQNSQNIEYAVEAKANPAEANPVQKLYVINNTIINQYPNAGDRYAVWVNNAGSSGLQEVKIENNIISGMPASQIVIGDSLAKVQLSNNVAVSDSSFYDGANRIYNLAASSPAINAGTDPGIANGFSLAPQYQFMLPHDGEVRQASGALDVGAYAYVAGKTITPAPTVTFSAAQNPISFGTSATLSWNATNASSCTASGGWSGTQSVNGTFTTPVLSANQSYGISCTGPSGTVNASISVVVNDSAQAAVLGTYTWRDISGSQLATMCPDITKFPGVTGFCNYRGGMATGVYVPDTQRWYLMGGSENYGYSGNEVYAFNMQTLKPERVTDPTILANTKEYNATLTPPYSLAACSRALHSSDDSVSMANNGIEGQASWNPLLKKIVIGPWGYQRQTGCTNISSYLTDQWTFDPFSKTWEQIAPPDNSFQSTTGSSWFLDPVTGIAYVGTGGRNAAPIGSYLLDYSTTPPSKALIDNTWPFALQGSMAVDTTHHYAFQLVYQATNAPAQVALYDLSGLSMTAYGTNGKAGTTGLAGGAGPQYVPDTSWTVTGDTTILPWNMPSLSYNPKLDMFVAWAGGAKVYFIQLNYTTKTANIISKQIPDGPTMVDGYGGLSGYLTYIPEYNEYLVFTGMDKDFYLLVPPGGGASGQQVLGAAVYNFSSNLTVGSHGVDVTALQQLLTSTGVYNGAISGYFGPLTKAGVIAYQKTNNISPALGYVGPVTREKLDLGAIPTTPEITATTTSVTTSAASTGSTAVTAKLTPSEVSSIVGLLQSFDVGSTTLARVEAALGQ